MGHIAGWLRRGLLWYLLWQAGLRAWRKLRPGTRPAWLEWEPLVRLRGLAWPAERIVARLALDEGTRAVELGAGTSGLTLALARAVGPSGHVLAVDHRASMVEALQIAALEQGLSQVTALVAPAGSLPAEATDADLIALAASFGSLPDRQAAAEEIYRLLRPGGAIAVTEFVFDPDACMTSTVVTHLVLAGFGIEREVGSFAARTILARKPA
jgi:ubiquinone/menaquinone biosynthesis C-methylase UbiE